MEKSFESRTSVKATFLYDTILGSIVLKTFSVGLLTVRESELKFLLIVLFLARELKNELGRIEMREREF